jgi:endonuclease YncB( thermonuclease family)
MKLHELIEISQYPCFRKMKVESGYMYNFYDTEKDEYKQEWTFVPEASERVKNLEHHKATTVGLWATDRPDLIHDPKELLFEIK